MALPPEIEGLWRGELVLKRDVFSTVERGWFISSEGEVEAVLRRIDEVPWWTRPIARILFAQERRTLAIVGKLGIAPPLHFAGRHALVRGWIPGVPLQIGKPQDDDAYFRSAKLALCKLRRAGICHNDLSKQQNWLRGSDGKAYLTDFQLAFVFPRRGFIFRTLAYEDLRHLLKHKHRYAREAMTPAERRLHSRKSFATRIWMATVKPIYDWVAHDLFGFRDREGAGTRLFEEAPAIAELIKAHPQVRDTAVVAYFDRGARSSLYAFVEAPSALSETALREYLAPLLTSMKPPERMQVVEALPRLPDGAVRTELLQLIATNQIELLDPLIADEAERVLVTRIIAARQNLSDRI